MPTVGDDGRDFGVLEREMADLFRDVVALGAERLAAQDRERLLRALDRVQQGQFFILVLGEFKRGKSSLLNALVGERDLLPVAPDTATSVICTVAHADQDRVTVYLGEPEMSIPRQITRADIPSYVTEPGIPGNRPRARLVQIETPSPRLRPAVVLVDTPGIGGIDPEHAAATFGFLPSADAVVFVADAVEELSSAELAALETAARYCDTILVAVTKIDKIVDETPVVVSTRRKVAVALGRPVAEVTVVPVSSSRHLDAIEDGDPELDAASNIATFSDAIWNGIARNSGAILLARAGGELTRALELCSTPLNAEIAALRSRTDTELAEVRRRLEQVRTRADLLRSSGRWEHELAAGIDNLRAAVLGTFDARIRHVAARFGEQVARAAAHDEAGVLLRDVVRDMTDVLACCGAELSRGGHELLMRMAAQTSLDLAELVDYDLRFEAATRIAPVVRPSPWRGEALVGLGTKVTEGWSLGVHLGGAVGGLVGSVFGASVPGAAIGAVIGGIGSSFLVLQSRLGDIERQQAEAGREALEAAVLPVFEENVGRARVALTDAARELGTAMARDLAARLMAETAAVVAALRSLEQVEAMSRAERDRSLGRLEREEADMAALRARVEAFTWRLPLPRQRVRGERGDSTGPRGPGESA